MLIVKKLHDNFPHRVVEWGLAYMVISWGMTLLLTPGAFYVTDVYSGLRSIMPQDLWGAGAVAVGMLRLAALYVNGTMAQTPPIRVVTAFCSMLVWLLVFVGMLRAPVATTGIVVYFWLMVADQYSIYAASRDWAKNYNQKNGALEYAGAD